MIKKVYHSQIYLPETLIKKSPIGIIRLTYSMHAIDACNNDKYGKIPLFKGLNTDNAKIIEITTINEKIEKILYRKQYNDKLDIIISVNINTGMVITCWYNAHDDNHYTLNKNLYQKKEN